MLTEYLTQTQNLLQNPGAPVSLYSTTSLISYINTARGQLAGESKSIRYIGTISTIAGQRNYNYSAISTNGPSSVSGVQGVVNIRTIEYGIAQGQKWVEPRSWTWFNYYYMGNPVPVNGVPLRWAQLGQGVNGTFYLDPPPDMTYTLFCDVTGYPINLIDDTTTEAIPYLWTDAVPYFAAYLAYLSAQSPARQADAQRMMQLYEQFVQRARTAATPDLGATMYPQNTDPTQLAKLGLSQRQQQAAGGGSG